MRPRVFEVVEVEEEDGTKREEYRDLKLVEVIENRPEMVGGENIGRFINVVI